MQRIKVLIADDQLLIRDGISIILNSQPDIEVLGAVSNGYEAVRSVCEQLPDVVLLDIQMPGMSGIDALREIKAQHPETVVIMLTTFDPDDYILRSFRYGADGYLLKDLSGDRLVQSIRDAYAGYSTIPVSIAARLIAQIPEDTRRKSLADYGMTGRELEIVELVSQGYRNEMIAQALHITLGTVKNYVSTIYSKLEVTNRQQAVMLINALKRYNN